MHCQFLTVHTVSQQLMATGMGTVLCAKKYCVIHNAPLERLLTATETALQFHGLVTAIVIMAHLNGAEIQSFLIVQNF